MQTVETSENWSNVVSYIFLHLSLSQFLSSYLYLSPSLATMKLFVANVTAPQSLRRRCQRRWQTVHVISIKIFETNFHWIICFYSCLKKITLYRNRRRKAIGRHCPKYRKLNNIYIQYIATDNAWQIWSYLV